MKTKAILLETDHTGKIVEIENTDEGTCIVGDKEFYIDKTYPILLEDNTIKNKGKLRSVFKKGKNIDKYYVLKADTIIPFMTKMEQKIQKFNVKCPKCGTVVASYPVKKNIISPVDMKFYKHILTPKALKDTIELRFLKNLKKYSEPKSKSIDKSMIKTILYLAMAGVGVYIALISFGVIK